MPVPISVTKFNKHCIWHPKISGSSFALHPNPTLLSTLVPPPVRTCVHTWSRYCLVGKLFMSAAESFGFFAGAAEAVVAPEPAPPPPSVPPSASSSAFLLLLSPTPTRSPRSKFRFPFHFVSLNLPNPKGHTIRKAPSIPPTFSLFSGISVGVCC